jgi:hypothetical protein
MILKSPDEKLVTIKQVAICRKCKHYHDIDASPASFGQRAFDWEFKHRACELERPGSVEFLSPTRRLPRGFDDRIFEEAGKGPWWADYRHNADLKIAYAADAAFTIDLSALGASSTWVSGRESTSVDNTSNKYVDYRISGKFISGTTPTIGDARLYYLQPTDDTPTWPDVFDGTDSAETVTNSAIVDKLLLGWSGSNSTSTNITYPIISALTLAQAFGIVPDFFGLFFTHSQVAALKTDAGNTNSIFYKGIYFTAI